MDGFGAVRGRGCTRENPMKFTKSTCATRLIPADYSFMWGSVVEPVVGTWWHAR
jgi:hypothetical protein